MNCDLVWCQLRCAPVYHRNRNKLHVQGENMKRNPEMGETAIQPVPAKTADLSISGLRFMSSPYT